MENIKGGFHIISNVLNVSATLPLEIGPTLRFRRADDDQIEMIRDVLPQFSGSFQDPRSYYENEWFEVKESATTSRFRARKLERHEWRYYILAFSGLGNDAHDFLSAAYLSQPALYAVAHIYTDGLFGGGERVGWGGDMLQGVMTYEMPHSQMAESFGDGERTALLDAYSGLTALDAREHPGIARAIDLINGLKRIPKAADLRILGLFSIIEMLLTHNPGDKEIGDSLSHQISTKVPLLSRRFRKPLSYETFGPQANESTVWKKLYEYRSKIAHGERIDFEAKLQLLKDRNNVQMFLEDATRRLVRHALLEPMLVDSLKPV